MELYKVIARAVGARQTCGEDHPWFAKHQERVELLVRKHLPSGAGWDAGTTIDWDRSTGDKLIFYGSYHHMEDGFYAGWTDYDIVVEPSLGFGFTVEVVPDDDDDGRDALDDDLEEYLGEIFDFALWAEVDEWEGVLPDGQ